MTDQTPTNTLTDTERAEIAHTFHGTVWLSPERAELIERIKADAYAAGLAAREAHTNAARGGNTDNGLRAAIEKVERVRALAHSWAEDDTKDPAYALWLLAELGRADAAPAPTDNQRDDGLADREVLQCTCGPDAFIANHCRHLAGCPRAVVDGPTTPTDTPAASEGETNP